MADPSRSLIEDFPDGILQAILSAKVADHGEIASVGGPVRPLHAFQNFARSAAAKGHARQNTAIDEGLDVAALEQNGHFSCRRDGEHLGVLQAKRPGLWALRTRRKNFNLALFPGSAVERAC